MVQKQMKLHRPFGLSELRPVKEAGAKLNDRGIQRKELALKSKPALPKSSSGICPEGDKRPSGITATADVDWHKIASIA